MTASASFDSQVSFAAKWSTDSTNLFSTPLQHAVPTASGSKTTSDTSDIGFPVFPWPAATTLVFFVFLVYFGLFHFD